MDGQANSVACRFDGVVGPHFEAMYRAALRLTRCREDAEDLVQEVALRVMPELDRIASLDAPLAWLLRVQYRLFVDGVRRRARSPIARNDGSADGGQAVSQDPGPEEQIETLHRRRQLARVWGELNRQQRALLALHAEGYTLAELETITGLSRNAIGVRLHRARARLAKLVRNETTDGLKLVRLEG